MAISSAGIGSGLDVNSIVSQLVALERQPIDSIDTKISKSNSQLSSLGRIKSAISSLQTALGKLNSASTFQGYTASFADTDYGSATATSYASAGSYSLRVEKLAQGNKLVSSSTPAVAAGTLTIELGSVAGGSFDTKKDSNGNPLTFTPINFSGSTLADLRSAINGAKLGVSATIVSGSGGDQLILSSDETGAYNTIKITGTGGLAGLSYDPLNPSTSPAFTEKQAAQDAEAYVDGVKLTSSTNVIEDALTGVTLTLKKAHSATDPTDATTLTVGSDKDGMVAKVQAFVKAWNDVNTAIKTETKYDATTKKAAALNGDSSVSSIANNLRNVLFSSPSGASSEYPRLSDLGISLQADGSLSLDSTKLQDRIGANMTAVTATITAFGSAFKTQADALTQDGGIISNRETGINSLVKSLGSRRDQLELQVSAIEKRYRAQFSALDVLMGKMQTQSAYLQKQLAQFS